MNNPDERDREKKKCYDQFRERKGGKRRGKADRQEHGTNRAQIKGCIKLTMHIAHTHTHTRIRKLRSDELQQQQKQRSTI